MPFIGTQPEVGGYSVLDALTASATASYTLQLNSVNFSPASANQLLVSLNGVIQKPGSSFTVSGSTLTFSSALTSSDSIDFILAMGEPLLVGTPSDATITGSKLASNIGISTTGNIATTGSGTLSVAGTSTLTGNTTVAGTLTSTGKITSTAGITFGSDTAAANVLDDYEEGLHTITPNSNLTLSSSHNVFKYTKIGRSVAFTGYTKVSSVSGSDTVSMSLPFTVSANPTNGLSSAVGYVMTNGVNIGDAGMAVFAYVGRNYLNFYSVNDNAGWVGLTNSDLTTNDEIYFSITYFTDS